jgi:hypothetical protein
MRGLGIWVSFARARGGEREDCCRRGVGHVLVGGSTFRSSEVNDVSIFFEHVHLFYGLDGLDVELLE